MDLPKMEDFEIKDAQLEMDEDSAPELTDINFTTTQTSINDFLETNMTDSDIEKYSSTDEQLTSLTKKRPRDPGYVVSTLEKINHYRDKYLENIENEKKKNLNSKNILEYNKWIKYIQNKDDIIKPNKKRKLIQPELLQDFRDLHLSRLVMNAINDLNWKNPTPVQLKTIPYALKNKDLLVNAVTGSGKTGAFAIPILERLQKSGNINIGSRVLIITPTRELAIQCLTMIKKLCKYIKPKIRIAIAVGGLSLEDQEQILRSYPDIIVCTPGRMIDLCRNSQGISLHDIEILILDEADRLLDMGFRPEINEILKYLPKKRQTMFFSATLSDEILKFAGTALKKNHEKVSVDPTICLNDSLIQEFIRVHPGQNKYRRAMIIGLCLKTFKSRVIIFCRTKIEAHTLRILFGLFGLNARELHGNLSQMDRLTALNEFKTKKVEYLLCTDVAARGLDIPNIKTVINIEFPTNIKTYIHRVGRTARAGADGYSVTLIGESRRKLLKKLVISSKKDNSILKSRKLNELFINWIYNEIEKMKPLITELKKEETIERDLRLAELELNKSINIVKNDDDIFGKNKKTWIMGKNEKNKLKRNSYIDNINDEIKKDLKDKIDKRIEFNEKRNEKFNKKHGKNVEKNKTNLNMIERLRMERKEKNRTKT